MSTVSLVTVTGWQNSAENNGAGETGRAGLTGAAVPCLHLQPAGQVVAESIETHILMRLTSVVRSIGAQKLSVGISSLPSDQLQPIAIEQVVAAFWSIHLDHSPSVVFLDTLTGWQKSAENNGVPSTTGLSVFMISHLHSAAELQALSSEKTLHGLAAAVEEPAVFYHLQK